MIINIVILTMLTHLRGVYKVKYINDTEYNLIKPNISKECYYLKLNC